ncbi:hypothetical protein QD460_25010 [Rhizobium jaguaris]|uniref:hypothetical protein n=1 Tax=Rhizobium jaguaris TaxID=1312183 RepID=UPI0039BF9853
MVFFANSGITWPHLESLTSDAGSQSLEAASELLSVIAKMEGRTETRPEDQSHAIDEIARKFRSAADLYEKAIPQVDDRILFPLSLAEVELASVYGPPWRDPDFFPTTPKLAYRDLASRLYTLAANVTDIKFEKPKSELAPLIFQLMGEWERLASMARLIAVLNLRKS